MKKIILQLLFIITFIVVTNSFSSCTYTTSDERKDNDKEWNNREDDAKINEQNRQENINGEIMQIDNKTIKKIRASFVDARIKVSYGSLFINDGNSNFVDAEFIYDKYDLIPILKYTEEKDRGNLRIRLTGGERKNIDIDTDNDDTKCLIELSNKVPMNLRIEFGVGLGKFNLNDLQLEELDMRLGAGEFDIDLSGSNIKELDIEVGVGSLDLDLSGKRKKDLYAEILGGIGKLEVKLPADIGVRVEIRGILGNIDVYGLKKRDKIYTNEAYGKTNQSIELNIRAGLGDVKLFLVD